MTKLTFILPDGSSQEVEATAGHSIMKTAISNSVNGIVAECNGSLACATCHVFLDDASAAQIDPPGETENDLLDFAAVERKPTSRLSCQVMVDNLPEGAVITMPETQV